MVGAQQKADPTLAPRGSVSYPIYIYTILYIYAGLYHSIVCLLALLLSYSPSKRWDGIGDTECQMRAG